MARSRRPRSFRGSSSLRARSVTRRCAPRTPPASSSTTRGAGTGPKRCASSPKASPDSKRSTAFSSAPRASGPFELLDLTGLDVSHPVMESIYHQFYEEPRFRPSPLTAQRLSAGLLGRKSARGFYDYGVKAAEQPGGIASARSHADPARRVWISARETQARARVAALVASLGAQVVDTSAPPGDALCLVLPLGRDATTAALDEGLDPARTLALDAMFDLGAQRTLMKTPVTSAEIGDSARALFAADGAGVDLIHDSPGFVAQRVLAHIVNIACDIAQQRIATPADIDLAVRIGLGYPSGPLAWGDSLGAARILRILEEMSRAYGDPRYRASPWLSRRARLGVSLLTPES
jgi:3-hydroxybutyryl-CoA dehydrogenase